MFDLWVEHYVGKRERDRAEAFTHIVATSEDYARATVPSDPFVCSCGEVLDNPCDPQQMAVHQPHYLAAKNVQSR